MCETFEVQELTTRPGLGPIDNQQPARGCLMSPLEEDVTYVPPARLDWSSREETKNWSDTKSEPSFLSARSVGHPRRRLVSFRLSLVVDKRGGSSST